MVAANDDDDSGQGLGRWSKIPTTTVEPRDLEVVQDFDEDDNDQPLVDQRLVDLSWKLPSSPWIERHRIHKYRRG